MAALGNESFGNLNAKISFNGSHRSRKLKSRKSIQTPHTPMKPPHLLKFTFRPSSHVSSQVIKAYSPPEHHTNSKKK
jgi:hypothetical protein